MFERERLFITMTYAAKHTGRMAAYARNGRLFRSFQLRATGAVACSVGTCAFSTHSSEKQAYIDAKASWNAALPEIDEPLVRIVPNVPIVVLYQYATCPFCNKVRAYLDYTGVPYVIVEVDPLLKSAIGWSDYRKVPIAIVNGKQVNDSSAIIDHIDALLAPEAKLSKGTQGNLTSIRSGSAEEAQWRAWVDATLVKYLTVNIYRSWDEALTTFDYLTQKNFQAATVVASKYVGSAAMVQVAKKRRKELGIADGGERAALYALLDSWADAIQAKGTPFLGGSKPDLADVSVFGAMRSIEGLPTMKDALEHSRVGLWYVRMTKALYKTSALQHRVGERPLLA